MAFEVVCTGMYILQNIYQQRRCLELRCYHVGSGDVWWKTLPRKKSIILYYVYTILTCLQNFCVLNYVNYYVIC